MRPMICALLILTLSCAPKITSIERSSPTSTPPSSLTQEAPVITSIPSGADVRVIAPSIEGKKTWMRGTLISLDADTLTLKLTHLQRPQRSEGQSTGKTILLNFTDRGRRLTQIARNDITTFEVETSKTTRSESDSLQWEEVAFSRIVEIPPDSTILAPILDNIEHIERIEYTQKLEEKRLVAKAEAAYSERNEKVSKGFRAFLWELLKGLPYISSD